MRRVTTALLCIALVGCQSAQQADTTMPGTAGGSTTYARGTPDTTRSDTTRVSGAAPSPDARSGASLALDRESYAPGASVSMRITNHTGDTLGYNPCSSRSVERQQGVGGSWIAHPEPDRMCTMELRLLMPPPRETQTAGTDLPADLRPGTYRMVLLLSRQRSAPAGAAPDWGTVRAVSSTFRVQ